jgi:hypothetical protein
MKTLPKFLKVFFSLFVFILSIHAQEFEQFRYWTNGTGFSGNQYWIFGNVPQNEITKIKKRWDEIGESFKSTSNPFAGTYFQSGNRGYYFRWSPEKGFVYVYYYEYFVRDASYGKVLVTDSEIKFIVEREMQNKDITRKLITPTVWIPVYEGKYFVRKTDIQSFGNFYGGFGDFNGYPQNWGCDCSPFAERQGKITLEKSFIVPPKYRRFIKNPINGKIISIGKRKISLEDTSVPELGKKSSTFVTINVGRKNGVRRRMMFLLINEGDNYEQVLKVTRVGERTSHAVIERSADDKGNEVYSDGWDYNLKKIIYKSYPKLRPGIKITTSAVLAGL